MREAGDFLAKGYYPLFRMTSVYAAVRTFSDSPTLAFVLHGIGALTALGSLVYLWWRGCPPRILAAAACVSSLFVSPYSYDYDMTILGLGIAFVLPDIIERAGKWELLGLLLLGWFATGYGFAMVVFFGDPYANQQAAGLWSLGAVGLILFVAAAVAVLRRHEGHVPTGALRELAERAA